MADPFLAEIRMFGCNFAPRNWAYCNGQLLSIASNTALFSLLGTMYGGDGRTTFGLPNLEGRAAIHAGNGPGLSSYQQGQMGGSSTVTLVANQLPGHGHSAVGNNNDGSTGTPTGNTWATPSIDRDVPWYDGSAAATALMNAGALQNAGGGQPHNNLQPYQTVGFCICTAGVYPSRN